MKLEKPKKEVPQFISPSKILAEIGLKPGMSVIDYASGAGHWTIAAAKMVAPTGNVFAIENDINMLSMLQSKAESEKISNIEIEEVELEKGTSKDAQPADLVIVSNILYLIKDKKAFLDKAVALTKLTGKIIVIDWVPTKTMFGPPVELRFTEESVISILEKAGMSLVSTVEAGSDHFGILMKQGVKDEAK